MARSSSALFAAVIFSGFLISSAAQAQSQGEALVQQIQQIVDEQSFEGTILIADEGDVVFHDAFGHTDQGEEVPVLRESHFGIASITKLFTAIAILQLLEEEALTLDDSLEDLLPELGIRRAGRITVHHLLLHISGLPNESDLTYRQQLSPEEFVVRTLEEDRNRFGRFNYANIDYVLLGMIVAREDGVTWEEAIRQRILDPVGLDETGFLSMKNAPEPFARTFSYQGDQRVADPAFHIENFGAAGRMYSTAADLLKLDQAMYTDVLLSEDSKKLLYTSYPEYNYSGYSVWTYEYPYTNPPVRVMERRGGILGSNSALVRLLDLNRTIIILSNNDRFDPDTFGQTESLKEALLLRVAGGGVD